MKFLETMQHIKIMLILSLSIFPILPALICLSRKYCEKQRNSKTSIFKVFAFLRVLNANSPSIYWASTHVLGDANDIQSRVFLKGMT